MKDTPEKSMIPDRVRELVEAGAREAAALKETAGRPQPPRDAVPGFDILAEIGRGGMGVVYQAIQLSTKRVVALKVMLAGVFASRSANDRFEREVRLTARLQHPGIVRVLESGVTAGGQPYYAMDHVDGVHLDHWIALSQPDVRTTLRLFIEICRAVEHAHQHGVIHRDLKPANVLIDAHNAPHILDFGLSKAMDQAAAESTASATVSAPGQVVGTLRYLSPEQAAAASGEIDARTDVYALGVLLCEALTGTVPIDTGGTVSRAMERILEQPPRPPSSLSGRVDRELEAIILKTLEKEKHRRYSSVAAFAEDIARYVSGEPVQARPQSSLYILRKKLVKQRLRIGLAMAAILLGLAGLWGGTWWRDHALARHAERERISARHQLLRLQCRLEEGAGRAEDLLLEAQPLLAEHRDLAESYLVCAQVWYRVAQQRGEDLDRAIATLERGRERSPSPWACNALLAEICGLSDDPQAEQLRRQAEEPRLDTAEACYIRSLATLDASKAVQYAEQAVRREPQHALAWERLASLYLTVGDTDGALRAAEALMELGEDAPQCLLLQARVLIMHRKYREAIERYGSATELGAGWAARRCRALAHLCLKEYDAAIEDYTRAAELHGEFGFWERFHRATPLWITGRLAEAERDYREFAAWRGFPSYADARLFLLLRQQGRQEEAGRVLATARGGVQSTWLGEILAWLAGEITPVDLAALAQTETPPNRERLCEAYYYAGEVCLLTGRANEAREWFDKCVRLDIPFDPDSEYLDPMNEHHLARWRLDQLAGEKNAASRPSP